MRNVSESILHCHCCERWPTTIQTMRFNPFSIIRVLQPIPYNIRQHGLDIPNWTGNHEPFWKMAAEIYCDITINIKGLLLRRWMLENSEMCFGSIIWQLVDRRWDRRVFSCIFSLCALFWGWCWCSCTRGSCERFRRVHEVRLCIALLESTYEVTRCWHDRPQCHLLANRLNLLTTPPQSLNTNGHAPSWPYNWSYISEIYYMWCEQHLYDFALQTVAKLWHHTSAVSLKHSQLFPVIPIILFLMFFAECSGHMPWQRRYISLNGQVVIWVVHRVQQSPFQLALYRYSGLIAHINLSNQYELLPIGICIVEHFTA